MIDLTNPAIREAGAQATRRAAYFPLQPRGEWDALQPYIRDSYRTWWDRIAAELAPVIRQVEARERGE